MASNRRRRESRHRYWGFWRRHELIYWFANEDRMLPDGTIKPGERFETWSVRHHWVRRPR